MGKYENPGESGVNGTRFSFADRYRQNRFFQVRGHDLNSLSLYITRKEIEMCGFVL